MKKYVQNLIVRSRRRDDEGTEMVVMDITSLIIGLLIVALGILLSYILERRQES